MIKNIGLGYNNLYIAMKKCVQGANVIKHYVCLEARAHKNRQLEEEHVTPIEARSPGKIIEPY